MYSGGSGKSATDAAPVNQVAPSISKKGETIEVRSAAIAAVMPAAVWNGRLLHPDSVITQRAGWRRTQFYRVMQEQNLSLAADCSQWEDRVNANDLLIRAGESGEPVSDQLANDMKGYIRRLPNTHIVNTWMLRCRWYGVTSIGKAGWRRDDETGLLLPFDLYNIDPWLWEFGPNFDPYLLTQNSFIGSRFDSSGQPWENSVFFCRWGSNFHGYGESDLHDIYLACWMTQQVVEMLLQSLQRLVRPIPWIEVGSTYDGKDEKEFNDFEDGIKRQYGEFYVITRTPNAATSVTFPNLTVLANGAAGASELAFLRYQDGQIQRRIHGTQQTQDQTSGSRSLEDTRIGVANDKTPPGLQLRDQAWNLGVLDHIGRVNYPNVPRQFWPVMDCAATDEKQLTGPQIVALKAVAEDIRLNNTTPEWATETLILVGFRPRKAEAMVASMFRKYGTDVVSATVSLDAGRLLQIQDAVNRLILGASTDDITEIVVACAGVPRAWAKSVVQSVNDKRASLTAIAPTGRTQANLGAVAAEAREMAETLSLLEKIA